MSKSVFGGPIEVGYINDENWEPQLVVPKNTIVNSGQDILGQLLAGNTDYQITRAYFEFENTAIGSPSSAPLATDDISYFTGLGATYDYVIADIDLPVGLAASGADFLTNLATFFVSTHGQTVGENGNLTLIDGTSNIVSVGLVARPGTDKSSDVLFARFAVSPAIRKIAGSNVGAKWNITFE